MIRNIFQITFYLQIKNLTCFIIIIICLASSCGSSDVEKAPKTLLVEDLKTGEIIENVTIIYSDSAIIKAKVTAPLMQIVAGTSDQHKAFPKGVKADFYDGSQQPTSSISSKKAFQYEFKRQIVLRDSVVFSNATDRLETEEMVWDEYQQRISSTKFVKIVRPDELIYGYGFESNQSFSKWKIHAITGRLRVNDLINGDL